MYSMQYRVQLPADYDMEIIRNRVRRTGHLMDGYPGLEFKAYLIQEKAKGAMRTATHRFTSGTMRRECDLSAGESPGIHQLCAISAVTPSKIGQSTNSSKELHL